ncbi:DNA polymerase III subunit alpha [Lysinibacter cavernae]|uniref:DNA polymerase III subunit alpha n=1 Tax=Lysinibacter cavernae TaxID=1640652 RepID=UPI003612B6B8
MSYCHLHVHSEHSLLDGLSKVADLFDTAASLGQTAIAITDHGSMASAWRAQKEATRTGVKFIPGLEAYLAIGSRFDRDFIEVSRGDASDEGDEIETSSDLVLTKKRTYQHLTLLAKDDVGWTNLVALHNESAHHISGRGRLIDFELLNSHSEGLIVLTGCLGGPILGPLSRGQLDIAEANLIKIIHAVGRENVFVEVMEHGIEEESRILNLAIWLAEEYQLKVVATNDTHHTHAEESSSHGAWLALGSKSTIAAPKMTFNGSGYHLKSELEMLAARPEDWWRVACENSALIASMVNDRVVPLPKTLFPRFPVPKGFSDSTEYFVHRVRQGIANRYPDGHPEERRAQLNFEVNVVFEMGFVEYFLTIDEAITNERDEGYFVGPGRGSAAGSELAYVMGITQVPPEDHDLLFDRFLEPGRLELPDIDVDFERRRKMNVIQHFIDVYGESMVALIGNVGTLQAKQAIKDAAGVLSSSAAGISLAKAVPEGMGLPELVESDSPMASDFQKLMTDPTSREITDLALTFFNVAKSSGIHASGVIVSPVPLTDLIPMRRKDGIWITEWDMRDLEGFGLVKLDILSIRNLDMAHYALDFLEEQTGEHIDLYDIPHPDTKNDARVNKAWDLIRRGHTSSLFQMEGSAMTALIQNIQPDCLDDLSAAIALFRPGPLSAGMDKMYANRKNGRERVSYSHFTSDEGEAEWISKVLGNTFGTFVYQEQIMLLGTVVAGFDDVWRSKLRKAISKKIPDLMAQVGERFVKGATEEKIGDNGELLSPVFSEQTAHNIWIAMQGSAEYLFNKSHSVCYALLAFYTAFLKANWAANYGAATLAVTSAADKRVPAMDALIQEGIEILPPDVNVSGLETRPEGEQAIRLGLGEIKQAGESAEAAVARRDGRQYVSFEDFVERARLSNSRYIQSDQLDALIASGALDQFGSRLGLTMVGRTYLQGVGVTPPPVEWGYVEKAARQRAVILKTLGPHPASVLREVFDQWRMPSSLSDERFQVSATPVGQLDVENLRDGDNVILIGILTSYSERAYRKGKLANITIEDATGSISAVLWDRALRDAQQDAALPPLGFPTVISGRASTSTFEIENEDGEAETIHRREVTVSKVYSVDFSDDPAGAYLDPGFPTIDLTADNVFHQPKLTSAEEISSLLLELGVTPAGRFDVPTFVAPVAAVEVAATPLQAVIEMGSAVPTEEPPPFEGGSPASQARSWRL